MTIFKVDTCVVSYLRVLLQDIQKESLLHSSHILSYNFSEFSPFNWAYHSVFLFFFGVGVLSFEPCAFKAQDIPLTSLWYDSIPSLKCSFYILTNKGLYSGFIYLFFVGNTTDP
jgi:hypothetical protein